MSISAPRFRIEAIRAFTLDLFEADFEKSPDGCGAGFDALTPAVFVNALQKFSGHREDNPIRRLLSFSRDAHFPIMPSASNVRKCIGYIIDVGYIADVVLTKI